MDGQQYHHSLSHALHPPSIAYANHGYPPSAYQTTNAHTAPAPKRASHDEDDEDDEEDAVEGELDYPKTTSTPTHGGAGHQQ